jgi:hypothetical protein
MPNRIHPLSSSSTSAGRVHAPGTGPAQGPRGPQGPTPTHPKTLERIGPLAGLVGRGARHATEADTRRAELPRSRDAGGSRSWMSSMMHAASKTGHAISHGFNRAGQVVHKFGQARNEAAQEPAWMQRMSEEERGHYDYYGELPAESSHATHAAYVAPPWDEPSPSMPAHRQEQRQEVQHRPAGAREHVQEARPASRRSEMPRAGVEEPRPQRPAPGPTGNGRDALLANIRETMPRIDLRRLDHAEPRDFVRLARTLARGTRYEQGMSERAAGDPALGAEMKQRWNALQNHLAGLRAQGAENVPSAQWLFENRSIRMMAFLVDGSGGEKLVAPTPAARPSPEPAGAAVPRPGSAAITPQTRALRSEVQNLVESYVVDRKRSPETRERPLAAMEALEKLSDFLTSPAQYGDLLSELKTLLRTSNRARRNAGLATFTDKVNRFAANIDRAKTEPQAQPQERPQAAAPRRASAPPQAQARAELDIEHFRRQEEQRADYHHERPDYAAATAEYLDYLETLKEPVSQEPARQEPAASARQPRASDSRTEAPAPARERPLEAFYRDEEGAARYRHEEPDYAEARKAYETQGAEVRQPAAPPPLPGAAGKAVQEFRGWMSTAGFAQRFGSAGRNLMSDALGALEQHGPKLPPGTLQSSLRELSRIVGESMNNPVKLGQLQTLVADIRAASRPTREEMALSPADFLAQEQARARYHSEVASEEMAARAYQAYRQGRSS